MSHEPAGGRRSGMARRPLRRRLITRERGFAAVVIMTLALAVAANTAIYSVIDAVMFRRLPSSSPSSS